MESKLTDSQRKTCKHKIVVINPQCSGVYCKRCFKNLAGQEYHNFVTKKIEEGKWETDYDINAKVWVE